MAKSRKPSERQQRETAAERDRLKAILDSMDDGIYIVGRNYRIDFMNLTLRSTVGNGEGQLCFEFFGHAQETCEHCQHHMSSFGPEIRREWTLARTGRTYDMAVSPIHQPDGTIARLHILRDITERKALETRLQEYSQQLEAKVAEQAERLLQQERMALLGEISAGLAHEIRTPLGAIITGIRLLEKGDTSPEERKMLFSLLERETARLERKVSEFLIYAKPRLPQRRSTDLARLFEEVRAVLRTDRQLLGDVQLQFRVDSNVPLWLLDGEQIKEALLNLAMNALQALQGSGSLSFEARVEGNTLELLIRDSGPGIPMDALPNIFKPFFSGRPGGTGLGLSICREIIKSHDGQISVTSLPGLHTTFRITLPAPHRMGD